MSERALTALYELVFASLTMNKRQPVGYFVLVSSPEKRSLLAELKSEDLAAMRSDLCLYDKLPSGKPVRGRWSL